MFIHWGPVSLTHKEIGWSRGDPTPIDVYDDLYHQFNPTNFNADDWVSIAKAAGMKYIVLTTKHHDGFCLWSTTLTHYNIMNTPFHRDVVKELVEACEKQGIEFGAYYSVCDWRHPDFPLGSPGGRSRHEHANLGAYNVYLLGQLSELITNYGPLLTIWNDMPQQFRGRGAKTIRLVRELQPNILINNRTGDGGDYDTPEQEIGNFQMYRPWESCMTISAHNQWAWGGDKDGVKSTRACLEMLIRAAGGDGNLLLNVGPRPDGLIDPEQVARLKEVGAWLARNGASIYDTRGGPWKPTQAIVSTRKGKTIYVHILNWPHEAPRLPAIPAKITSARSLGGHGTPAFRQTDNAIEISLPVTQRAPYDTVIALELDSDAMAIPPLDIRTVSLTAPDVRLCRTSNVGRAAGSSGGELVANRKIFRSDPNEAELEAFLAEQREGSVEASEGGKEQEPDEGKDVGQG